MTAVATKSDLIFTVFIRATPEQIWDAITKPEFTTKYFYGCTIDSTFEPGAPYLSAAGDLRMADGEILEADPPRLLRHSWRTLWVEEAARDEPSRVSWVIEPQDDRTTKLTVIHDKLENSPATAASIEGGWSFILSGLKTLLETGKPLAT
jgi:uncharacterized protein YndB with AHSA1/START domain